MDSLELDDIQGLVRSGYNRFDVVLYRLLAIDRPKTAKGWLRRLLKAKWIDNAMETTEVRIRRGDVNYGAAVAFTSSGLMKLGLSKDTLRTFVSEFQEGIDAAPRARLLGDVGASAPQKWKWGNRKKEDILLIVFANRADLPKRISEVERIAGPMRVVRDIYGKGGKKEPFGFADGISQPLVEGLSRNAAPGGERSVKAGEFVLGYLNEFNQLPASPSVADDPHGLLPRVGANGRADLGRNGTFLVLRQLEQNVDTFRKFVGKDAKRGARMVGRWEDGSPLVRFPKEPGKNQDNDFGYHHDDRHGFRCPIGAHIRRANPRDSLADSASVSPQRARELVDQHRLLRRGRPYREDSREGLLFLCLNTNIERQFEFVQSSWLMHPEFGGLHDETDPLLGNALHGKTRDMTIQESLLGRRIPGLEQFVTVKGGGYFFLPGLKALEYLSRLPANQGG